MGKICASPYDDRVKPALAKGFSISHVRNNVFAWVDICAIVPYGTWTSLIKVPI